MGYANVNKPMGFRLFKGAGKNPHRVKRQVEADANKNPNDLMVGDCYMLSNDGDTVERAAANSDTILGVVEGIVLAPHPDVASGLVAQDYISSGDGGYIIGIEDQDALFEVEALTTAATDIGDYFELVDAAGSTTLRQSRQYVRADQGTNKQFIVEEIIDRPTDNAAGSYGKVAVRICKQTLQQKD